MARSDDNLDDSPASILDGLRDHPEWDEDRREAAFDRLISRFDLDEVTAAVADRLGNLTGGDAEAMLRIVEASGSDELLAALAGAIEGQQDLPAERAWEAMGILQGSGWLELSPTLAERWGDLNEAFDGDFAGSIRELAAQLEDDPDGAGLAVEGLRAIEPEVRAEIVAGLAAASPTPGPGVVHFLRLVAADPDEPARPAALAALDGLASETPPAVAGGIVPTRPWLQRSLVTAVDGDGRGHVVLLTAGREEVAAAAFECDVRSGLIRATGSVGPRAEAERFATEFAARPERDAIEDAHELALELLAGSLRLNGPEVSPDIRMWLSLTVDTTPAGPPPVEADPEIPPDPPTPAEMAEMAASVLDALPEWRDDSDLARELARELRLRNGGSPPDPVRDAGAYRYLFEHRLGGRLELYRRMLLWMAAFWHASGSPELSRSARSLATQLSDPQHAVPGHPFLVALAGRSLRGEAGGAAS